MKWLRHLLDRLAARWEPHCPDDWMDDHGSCKRCARIEARNVRLAKYRLPKRLPKASVL